MSRLKHKMLDITKKAIFIILTLAAFSAANLALTASVTAAPLHTSYDCPDGFTVNVVLGTDAAKHACDFHKTGTPADDRESSEPPVSANCGKAKNNCDCKEATLTPGNCGIVLYLWLIINVLSVLTGIVLVISLIAAGIQWSTAGDNPQQLSAAKTRVFNVIIALFLFIFTYAFLQWVVPGGIF